MCFLDLRYVIRKTAIATHLHCSAHKCDVLWGNGYVGDSGSQPRAQESRPCGKLRATRSVRRSRMFVMFVSGEGFRSAGPRCQLRFQIRCTAFGALRHCRKINSAAPRDAEGTAATPRPARFLPTSSPGAAAGWLSRKLRVTPGVRNGGSAPAAIPPTIRPATVLRGRLRPGMFEPTISESWWNVGTATLDRDALVGCHRRPNQPMDLFRDTGGSDPKFLERSYACGDRANRPN